jgi:hypothetical protein
LNFEIDFPQIRPERKAAATARRDALGTISREALFAQRQILEPVVILRKFGIESKPLAEHWLCRVQVPWLGLIGVNELVIIKRSDRV